MTRNAALAVTLMCIAFAADAAPATEVEGRRSLTSGGIVGDASVPEADAGGAIPADESAVEAEADASSGSAAADAAAATLSEETHSDETIVGLAELADAVDGDAGAEAAAGAADGRPTDDVKSVNTADDAVVKASSDDRLDGNGADDPRSDADRDYSTASVLESAASNSVSRRDGQFRSFGRSIDRVRGGRAQLGGARSRVITSELMGRSAYAATVRLSAPVKDPKNGSKEFTL